MKIYMEVVCKDKYNTKILVALQSGFLWLMMIKMFLFLNYIK